MPSKRRAVGPKRQKTARIAPVTVDAENCVTFDALVDDEYPLERIDEHLLRLLAYESSEGIAEVLALALRSIGCSVEFSITGVGATADEIVAEAESLEAKCLDSPGGCPSSYSMQRAPYARRVRALLVSVTEKLHEADNADVVLALAKYTAVLTTTRLQSLRLTGTLFAGAQAEALRGDSDAAPSLRRALVERASDVSPLIRRAAVSELASAHDASAATRAFNDSVGSVRLAAVRAVMSSASELDLESATLNRLVEMAQRDVELGVRRAALKLMATKGTHLDVDVTGMLVDADAQSRTSAAAFVVSRLARETRSPSALLVDLVKTAAEPLKSTFADVAASALAQSLDRQKVLKANWVEEIGNLLTQDLLREARSLLYPAEVKKQMRALAAELDNLDIRRGLLTLYAAMAHLASASSGSFLLDTLPRLISKLRFDDELLAQALSIAVFLPSEKLLERPESEQQLQRLFYQILEILAERSSPTIAKAASTALAALPDSHRLLLLRDAYHDLRLKLATRLGPRGEVSNKSRGAADHILVQLLVLARFVDVTDLMKLPLWPTLMRGSTHMKQLVRAIGMKGDIETAERCIDKLMVLPSGPAVDEILQIYVSAKMRGLGLSQLPFDINERPPTQEKVWTAAVASGVI